MQTNKIVDITKDEVVPIAEKMWEEKQLLVMIHGYLEKDGTPVVSYEYGFGEEITCYVVKGESVLPTISNVYSMAAAWPEREINELLPISFEGLDTSQRLFLPDNMLEGKGQIIVTPISELRAKNGLD